MLNGIKSLARVQVRSEQRKEDIFQHYIQSLMRFQQMSPDLTDEDIRIVRIFVGSCLLEHMALVEQSE